MSLAGEIVKKSKGIPFLVTALGSLLRGKTNEKEWHLVITKLEEGHEEIVNILKLSYEQLPSYLKRCFRFCSIFGKGTDKLLLDVLYLWMALGFVSSDNRGAPLEVIGWNCINDLSSKSLFLKAKDGSFNVDEFGDLLMHDFVYDLAKSAAGDELAIVDSTTKEVSKNTRYIRLNEDYLSGNKSPQSLLSKAKKARLLMLKTSEHPLSKSFLQSIISNLKCLRVLDLENCQFEELPRTVGYMKHLRYLCLANNMRIKLLPNSICNLINLQTLQLYGCINLIELPAEIGRLENLRWLTVTTRQELLPQGIGFLTELRILVLHNCPRLAFLPMSTKQLQNLGMLIIEDCEELNLVHESWSMEGMNSLRTLIIGGLPKFKTLPIGVKGLPFTSLHHLVIAECKGLTEVTDWIQYLTSLEILSIEDCPNLVVLPHTFSMLKRIKKLHINETSDEESDEESTGDDGLGCYPANLITDIGDQSNIPTPSEKAL